MRYPLRLLIFVISLCDPIAAAVECRTNLGAGIVLAHCNEAVRIAFSFHHQPSAAELAEQRMFFRQPHAPNELQSLPRAGVYGTCSVAVNMSQHMLVGSWDLLKEEMMRLVSECVGNNGHGGVHKVHGFNFLVIHHQILARARMFHQTQKATPTAPFIPVLTADGHPARAA